jgi:hemerythrin-like metal-binding protein
MELMAYTKTHFTHEETLMRKTAYPQFIPHKIAHDRLMKQLEDFQKRHSAGQVGVSPETMLFLRTWLCDHVSKVDIHLGKWLAKVEPKTAEPKA